MALSLGLAGAAAAQDSDGVALYGANALDGDTNPDGFGDWREPRSGTQRNDPSSTPSYPSYDQPALFQASLLLHAFGNDANMTFWALPVGRNCYNPTTLSWTNSGCETTWTTWCQVPAKYYCGPTTRQQGRAATGSGVLGQGSQPPRPLFLPAFALSVSATGDLATHYPYLLSHTYASFWNDAASFFPGGGPAAGLGQKTHTGMNKQAGSWIVREGQHGFGGAMGLLGQLRARMRYKIIGNAGIYEGTGSWNMIRALGRVPYATPTGVSAMGKVTNWLNPHYSTLDFVNDPNGNPASALLRGSGTPWTTGSVTVYAADALFTTVLRRAGYDARTAGGAGNIQLVTPALTHWIGLDQHSYRAGSHTGHIGILTLQVPEPARWLLLAAGLALLALLRRLHAPR